MGRILPLYNYSALVDSGSDWCLFHAEVGEMLSIPVRRGESRFFTGIDGSRSVAFIHSIELLVANQVAQIRAGFVEGLTFQHGVLGQSGFFDRFVVSFHRGARNPFLEIEPLH